MEKIRLGGTIVKNMTKMEFDKFFCNRRIYLIVVIGIVFEIIIAMQMRTVMFEGYHKSVYKHYISEIEGDYNKEKKAYISKENEKMQELIDNEDSYERMYMEGGISADEYHRISDEIKTAKFRINTLEYLGGKTEYFDSASLLYSYFYDVEIRDYVEYIGFDVIAVIVILLLVIPVYTDDYYAGVILMLRSSKNGRGRLCAARLKLAVSVSVVVSILFSAIEFLTKYIRYDLGNLNARVGSLMIEKISVMPEFINNLSIWNYIFLIYILRIILSVLFGIAGLFAAKKCKGNIEAFLLMGVVLFVFLLFF